MDLNGAALERQAGRRRHAKCASEDDESGARQAGFPLGVSGRTSRDREQTETDGRRRLVRISERTACRDVAKTTPTERRATPVPMESQRSCLAVDATVVSW